MDKEQIGFIGHLALGKEFFDGQTVKTRTLYYGIVDHIGDRVILVDTYNRNKPLLLGFQTIKCLAKTRKIVIMLSRNGLRIYLPILYWFVKLFDANIYHCVIGGNDDELLMKHPRWIKYLNSFCANWYESKNLAEEMQKKGINSAKYLPNFKNIQQLSIDELMEEKHKWLKKTEFTFCTFSRVTKEKGISDAIIAINKIRKERHIAIKLDIYGPIEDNYRDEFMELLKKVDCVEYKGVTESDNSVDTLKTYYGLLFPTYFYGEGFPGTLIDAMCAGIPVIASNWHFNAEIITDGVDGIVYGNQRYPTLCDAILWSINHRDEFIRYREKFWNKSEQYLLERNVDIILKEMGVRG